MSLQVISDAYRSPNFNSRSGTPISGIVTHTTEGSWPSDIEWLCSRRSEVSCHYVISPDGKVYQIVEDKHRAWHSGAGTYHGINDWNSCSIGVEISHRKGNPYSPGQKFALRELYLVLIAEYGIRVDMQPAHRWIAPKRRSDPTDWTDEELHAFTAALYVPVPAPPAEMVYLTTKVTCRVREGPGREFNTALIMSEGTTAGYDPEPTTGESIAGNDDWYHRSDLLGFVWAGLLVPA